LEKLREQLRGSRDQQNGEVFPADYVATVKPLAERRIVLAGYRLADVLKQIASQETAAASASPPQGTAAPAGTLPAPQASGEIHGNTNTRVYHLPGCPGYNAMRQTNLVTFATEAAAQQAGYRRAGNCR
jgi:hypothetical protein